MVDLGTLGGNSSVANAVSNGQVVGQANTSSTDRDGYPVSHAFSWTQAGGMVDLGTGFDSSANAVSNGQAVGQRFADIGEFQAFSWTPLSGVVDLGTLGGSAREPLHRVRKRVDRSA